MSHDQEHVYDPELARYGYIPGNDHALPYLSKWSREMAIDLQQMPAVLQHLNCSYLSTPGQAPTLLALKQHLQSLAAVRVWVEERGKGYARGIAHITVPTRYYRIKRGSSGSSSSSDEPGTIFVIPAWEHHPAVEYTRRMEQGMAPTVASVPTPHWPDRVSELQDRYHGKAADGVRAVAENEMLRVRVAALEADVKALREDRKRVEDQADVLSEFAGVEQGAKALAEEVVLLRQRVKEMEAKEARRVV
ncbi:hypothetical protein MAPG_01603 [Magnaporthiopsis poae ATCC 64411]|uniref:Uncharacterized protein n=1 Tax=Magnaporthiopsis poae (strain ATCC 64411 / 73-15) TaxID=644358 RepID=A0A0C4DP49_MAGP6|nr:hypothetical protein MAPG_01603 [Magnaporthiopsis poae ATCC 64411]